MTTIAKQVNLSLFIKPTYVCKCDECNEEVSTKYGDPREKVFRYDSKEQIIPSSIRMLCSYCIDELFGYIEPYSIFE
jgi:hypothetical protein